ncbi:MAG: Vacuolar protein sorting-associated protein 62 [Bathelium mastoideum]|nr:MAG: Vacuolar protein sorting-associated protein 62 [Bathelium mastoideum]KAI9685087.1 MAG: Vacuolar protein sorting-associated protein 62 [Bathelium mastoideum]
MKKVWQVKLATLATISSFFGVCGFLELGYQIRLHRLGAAAAAAESRWIASSDTWADRQLCKWIGVCGLPHMTDRAKWTEDAHQDSARTREQLEEEERWKRGFWNSGNTRPEDWTDDERRLREIPQYVLDYAPFVHLYSGEEFWPCDIADHLIHTTPHLNYTPLRAKSDSPNLTNLNELNKYGPRHVYLQSDDNVEERPAWLGGKSNIPTLPDDEHCKVTDMNSHSITSDPKRKIELRGTNNVFGKKREEQAKKKMCGGRSDAPAVLVAIDKGGGVVDAFWFFFYSYNLGNEVLNVRFGNHIGDWEHTLVRFKYGEPTEVFFSEHSFGEAYAYDAVEKIGKRPVAYSATGTHAMYATPGTHAYILPWGLLHDETDRGPLWDPALNFYSYTYELPHKPFDDPDEPSMQPLPHSGGNSNSSNIPTALPSDLTDDSSSAPPSTNHSLTVPNRQPILRASRLTPHAPLEWFLFRGHWGDKVYPLSDERQYRFAGQYHYVSGPTGPWAKNLARRNVCQSPGQCTVRHWGNGGLGGSRVKVLAKWEEDGVDGEGGAGEEGEILGLRGMSGKFSFREGLK